MILVENILLDEELIETFFLCDLNSCKGACCTFRGVLGAPVLDEEVPLMEKSLHAASKYLSEKSKKILEKKGFVEGEPGNYTTVCIKQKDCVFVYYEGDVALCSLEKAYKEGESEFRKPISCHLFPIRVRDFGGDYLHYMKISECHPAIPYGKKKGVKLYQMLKDALIRAYGEDWYELLSEYAESNVSVDK